MRFSPNRQVFVCERGQHPSDAPRRIEVCEADTGAVLATFRAGQNPRWVNDAEIVAESATGSAGMVDEAAWRVRYVPANRGQLDARDGSVAVSDLKATTIRPRATEAAWLIPFAREPRLGPRDSAVAVRHPETGIVRLLSASGGELGLAEDARWGAGSLVWWLAGRVWGRSTPDQPTVELTIPGRACSHPCAVWHAHDGRLFVGMVLDAGELAIVEWGKRHGYPFGVSDGSGFDLDIVEAGQGRLRVCYFDPFGVPVIADVDVSGPPVSLDPPPLVDPWALVPDGTLIADASLALFGATPPTSPDGKRICFHKNVDQAEWREIDADGWVYHLFDRSRGEDVPTGTRQGWYLTPRECCKWAKTSFRSGESFSVQGEKVEFDTGARVRWTHRVTLYGLQDGGIIVKFDPRFPGQDYGPTKLYELHYNSLTAGARWVALYTPVSAKGRLPWGDASEDVVMQETPAAPSTTPGPSLPYLECPRLSVDDDPRKVTPMPDTIPLSEAIARARYPTPSNWIEGALTRYRNEVLLERDKIAPDSMSLGALRVFVQHYCSTMSGLLVERGVPGGDGWGELSVPAFEAASAEYRRITANPQ